MMVEEQFYDLMNRTVRNLLLIDELLESRRQSGVDVDHEGPFEFTQLLNSFLGAFALPRERSIPLALAQIGLEEAHRRWRIPALSDDFPDYARLKSRNGSNLKPQHLNDLVRLTRNGIMHGNFQIDGDRDIQRISFWNVYEGEKTWGATLPHGELRQFLISFVGVARYAFDEARRPANERVA